MRLSPQRGISIVEIIVASAIIAVSVVAIVGAIQVYMKIVHQNSREVQAALLLDETAEALQYVRDTNAARQNGVTYTVFWNGTGYELTTTPVALPYSMTRTVVFSQVRRNSSDQIASSGNIDPNTQKATITVSWPFKGQTKSLVSEMLIHDMYE